MKPGSNGASNPLIVLIKMVAGARNSYCSTGLVYGLLCNAIRRFAFESQSLMYGVASSVELGFGSTIGQHDPATNMAST
jgi:hypothetical protein